MHRSSMYLFMRGRHKLDELKNTYVRYVLVLGSGLCTAVLACAVDALALME